MNQSNNLWRIFIIGLLSATLLVLAPVVFGFNIPALRILLHADSFLPTLEITLINAAITSIILVLFGFVGALLLIKVTPFSLIGKNLGLLIIPITLGNISIAFGCKLIWGDSAFFSSIAQGNQINKLGFLLLLELYQFGLLFIYLFWMHLQNINKERLNFAIAAQFNFYQKLKDIYLPHTRNLSLLLVSIAFVFTFYEESKIAFLFKVSQGTNSELITNWLTRSYQTNLLVSPEFAQNQIFNASAIVLSTAIIGLTLLFLVLFYFIKKSTSIKLYPQSWTAMKLSNFMRKLGWVFGSFLIIVAILPIVLSLTKVTFSLKLSSLGFPLFMTLIATFACTSTAIFFGIASRLGWKRTLSSFNHKSLPFFILLFVLLLVPPIVILIAGYKWMGIIGYSSQTAIYIIWIAGHVLLTLPVLGSFVLFNHFRVSNNEIDYLKVYKLGKAEVIRYSFFRRFKAEYLLLLIIAYSFVWNEAVLNNLFSDYIPSFVSGMSMLITGRGADYEQAFGYLLVSYIVALLSAGIWRYIIEKAQKQMNIEP